jgi:hypothetical protein
MTSLRTLSGQGGNYGVAPTHGQPDEQHRSEADLLQEGVNIGSMVVYRIGAVFGPGAIAMAALIKGQHVVPGTHRKGELVPRTRMSGKAVQQQQRWGAGIAPIEIVQLHAVGSDVAVLWGGVYWHRRVLT